MSAKKFNTPFALLGDKVEIPTTAQIDGSVSFQQGYPFGYEADYTDPNSKDISRSKTNQLLFDITNAIREIQQCGVSEWSEDGKPYKINSLVYAPDGTVKQSLIANNNNDTTHSSWSNLINASILPTILDNISALPIGSILNAYTIFDNCIVAFGGEFNRADYPKLWAYLQANPTLVKTQAQWQTEATANGGICGFFSSGNGTTTFRVPNLDKAFLRPDSRTIASYQDDAIRNITGSSGVRASTSQETASGAFTLTSLSSVNYAGSATGGARATLDFRASRVVPTANENRPKNIAVLPLIVAK
ncbi:hypothetical protein [Aliarcobacter butzleri]|uniref:hypothetical protein n=1 Tax=Aliarcobacter butzleri TaxID=28197 RepID=UPI002B24099D|nr:hypothetical protein [Aliarcobacter butzleri]